MRRCSPEQYQAVIGSDVHLQGFENRLLYMAIMRLPSTLKNPQWTGKREGADIICSSGVVALCT